jgi:hypothetical protein
MSLPLPWFGNTLRGVEQNRAAALF